MREWLDTHGLSLAIGAGVALATALIVGALNRPPAPTIEVRAREPQPTPTVQVYVHVDGAVAEPGVYRLAADARIFEAIDAAGGATGEANMGALNLAARVADGQKLVVPGRAPPIIEVGASGPGDVAALPAGASSQSAAQPAAGSSAAARINVNTASQRVLESLPGIGPVTAMRIIQYRTTNGPFTRIDQLRQAGVNASTYERIKDLVTVS